MKKDYSYNFEPLDLVFAAIPMATILVIGIFLAEYFF